MRKPLKKIKNASKALHIRRKLRVRKKVQGTAERPRLCAIRSNKHLLVQVVNDETQKTLLSMNSYGDESLAPTREGVKLFGEKLAAELLKKNISKVVFDRNGRMFGVVLASLAQSIRDNGVQL